MGSSDSVCPLCRGLGGRQTRITSAVPRLHDGQMHGRASCDDACLYECPTCGRFAITCDDRADFLDSDRGLRLKELRLSALLRERTIRGLSPYWLQFTKGPYGPLERDELAPIDINELLTRWPRTVPERLDRTLCNLARLSPQGGHRVEFVYERDHALAFAATPEEAFYNLRCLVRRGLVDEHSKARPVTFVLTSEGWERFEGLTAGGSARENPVFVAMWFGAKVKKSNEDLTEAEMRDIYDSAIEPAVLRAGYQVIRADLAPHNDWIMDEVLGDIRLAPFVVADFTGNREGVYFEAGFARGLGTPVIHTCHEEHLEKAHFDTKQLNHVLWRTPAELRERLYHRIMATMGRGPYPPPTEPP